MKSDKAKSMLASMGKEPFKECPSCGSALYTGFVGTGINRKIVNYPFKLCSNDKCSVAVNTLTGKVVIK